MQATPKPRDHHEHHFQSSDTVRDIVIGLADGLTVPFALAAGLSGAVSSTKLIVVAGLAEIAAGSIAMGLGGYLAARGDAQHYESELKREQTEVVTQPEDEAEEIYEIFNTYGVSREAATPVLRELQAKPTAYVDFMMRFELGLETPVPSRAWKSAATIAASYIGGGMVPLLPYMVLSRDITLALRISVVLTIIALATFGAIKGRLLGTSAFKSSLQTAAIGGAAAAAAYALAKLLGSH
jgi:VIT1/CCC1 family predicted Fe2+/Mn2+ transporter